jgi:hypothetical protein
MTVIISRALYAEQNLRSTKRDLSKELENNSKSIFQKIERPYFLSHQTI